MNLFLNFRKKSVWDKAITIPGYNPSQFKLDSEGNLIIFIEYGKRNSPYGWEIDHIVLKVFGGSDHLNNLRPLNWYANASHGGRLSQTSKQSYSIE